MTERLYYDDPYLTHFSSMVLSVREAGENRSAVYLEKSAFYPTSGGQPFDTGLLGGHRIMDVYVDEFGDVAHVIEGRLDAGKTVEGVVDWQRRFDHMQQHAGEHILAGCVYKQLNGYTIGLHLGHADSSIDVELPGGKMYIDDAELYRLEDTVNAHIQADEPIRCWFPGEKELAALPLRKAPAVKEHVRVVQIGDWEYCACGGTHPSSTGQIGLVKIIDVRPSRGKLRLTFLCGQRAVNDYRKHAQTVKQLSAILSAGMEELPGAATELTKKLKNVRHELNLEKTARAVEIADAAVLIPLPDGKSAAIKCVFDDLHPEGLKAVAEHITSVPGRIALLGSKGPEGVSLLFARSENAPFDMGRLLSASAKQFGGKGGGKSDFARGSAPDERTLDLAVEKLATDPT